MALSKAEEAVVVTIDPETGFPALPEDAYWEVEQSGTNCLYINLMVNFKRTRTRTKLLFWEEEYIELEPSRVEYEYIYLSDIEVEERTGEKVKELLVEKADYIFRQWKASKDAKALLSAYVGKYPPKNLNQL